MSLVIMMLEVMVMVTVMAVVVVMMVGLMLLLNLNRDWTGRYDLVVGRMLGQNEVGVRIE